MLKLITAKLGQWNKFFPGTGKQNKPENNLKEILNISRKIAQ